MIPDDLFKRDPFGSGKEEKQGLLLHYLNQLQRHHEKASPSYARITAACGVKGVVCHRLEDFLFLPVRLFKEFALKSVAQAEVVTELVSSGTTAQGVSRIFLDRTTSTYQVKALASILKSFIGGKRMPMLIVDSEAVLKNPALFSARGAGILGISRFGRNHLYLLDKDMQMNMDMLDEFLEKFKDEEILIFGFTYMVWQHMYKELLQRNKTVDLSRAVLIHAGGWKKLHDEAVANETFKTRLKEACGIERVHNFYGMVEQVGSVFMECGQGHFHAPLYADIIARDPLTWKKLDYGREGIIEVISVLPYSYPGNVLLTEDTGMVLGEDDCPCGRLGKYFKVFGRIPQAELRGCSDTYAFGDQAGFFAQRCQVQVTGASGNKWSEHRTAEPPQIGSPRRGGVKTSDRLDCSVLVPGNSKVGELFSQEILGPFCDEVLEFIGEFSRTIMKDPSLREFPEVVALGFWMRKAALAKLKKDFEERRLNKVLLGRGVVFHIAPANVDTIFIYSMFISMLAGNINIVRVSNKESPVLNVLVGILARVLKGGKFAGVGKRFLVVQYEHNDEITRYFSQQCDARVIWGGDETIRRIRAIPLKPTAVELAFADKFSFCILNAAEILRLKDFERLLTDFYNDSYWFDQMACSSIRLAVWIGDDDTAEKARTLFWNHFEETVAQKQRQFQAASAVDKLTAQYSMAITGESVTILPTSTNRIHRVLLGSPKDLQRERHCGAGLFLELKLKKITDIAPLVTRKDQTMAYFGFQPAELKQMVLKNKLKGIDRIVAVGKALEFSPIWDGFDLLGELCREVDV